MHKMASSDLTNETKAREMIISLLGRIAFPDNKLREIIVFGARKPEQMLKVYNLCDGRTTVSDIAKQAKVDQSSVSRAVDRWEEHGIILRIENGSEVLPRRLYRIE